MDVTVSIPDDVYEKVESLASSQEQSRSELYVQALELLLRSKGKLEEPLGGRSLPEWINWSSDKITYSLNQYAKEHGSSLDESWAGAQARTILENSEWD